MVHIVHTLTFNRIYTFDSHKYLTVTLNTTEREREKKKFNAFVPANAFQSPSITLSNKLNVPNVHFVVGGWLCMHNVGCVYEANGKLINWLHSMGKITVLMDPKITLKLINTALIFIAMKWGCMNWCYKCTFSHLIQDNLMDWGTYTRKMKFSHHFLIPVNIFRTRNHNTVFFSSFSLSLGVWWQFSVRYEQIKMSKWTPALDQHGFCPVFKCQLILSFADVCVCVFGCLLSRTGILCILHIFYNWNVD